MVALTLPNRTPWRGTIERAIRGALVAGVGTMTGAAVAYLVTGGLWHVAIVLLGLLPGFVLIHRSPFAGVVLWLLLVPLVLDIPALRPVYWLLHRMLPIGVLSVLLVTGLVGLRTRRLAALGWPEILMAGYLVTSVVSVIYTSDTMGASLIELYDRVAVPMALYLIVRLLHPTEAMFRWLVPVAAWVVVTQTVIGAASWAAPGALPPGWLGRAGSRTTGTLGSPSVYGITMLAAGLILFHAAANERRRWVASLLRAGFLVSIVMMVMTLTRGVWLAAFVGLVAAAATHPHQLKRVAIAAAPIVIVLVVSGAAAAQFERIETRFGSDETALSRLPVIYASLQMFEEKPVTGWGWGNFDKYDRDFQRPIGGFFPDKDQASHNVYLTLLAEQGAVGLALYLAPAAWWLVVSASAYRRLPRRGWMSRRLLLLSWAVLLGHVAVNNFSNMKVQFGLGQWWLVLGLIATLTASVSEKPRAPRLPRPTHVSESDALPLEAVS